MIEGDGEERLKTGKDMVGNKGREIWGSKTMEGFENQDKEFIPDIGVYWKPVEAIEEKDVI